MLAGPADLDGSGRARGDFRRFGVFYAAAERGGRVDALSERPAGVRGRKTHDVFGRAGADQRSAGVTALRPQIDDPVGRADHVQIVLDDEQRMAGVDQSAECAQELCDIVEVQPRGRLVE